MSCWLLPTIAAYNYCLIQALKPLQLSEIGTPGQGSRLSTTGPKMVQMVVQSVHLCRWNIPVASPVLKPKQRVWQADAPVLSNQAGLAWAAKPINAETGELGVLTTHETWPCFAVGYAGSTRPGGMSPQVQVQVCKCKYTTNLPRSSYIG